MTDALLERIEELKEELEATAMADLVERLRLRNTRCPDCGGTQKRVVGPDQDGLKYRIECIYCKERAESADALEAKDKQIEELKKDLMFCGDVRGIEGREYGRRIAELEKLNSVLVREDGKHFSDAQRLRAVLKDVDRWLAAFIAAWDESRDKKKPSEAPVALMQAIRQHSAVVEALTAVGEASDE